MSESVLESVRAELMRLGRSRLSESVRAPGKPVLSAVRAELMRLGRKGFGDPDLQSLWHSVEALRECTEGSGCGDCPMDCLPCTFMIHGEIPAWMERLSRKDETILFSGDDLDEMVD